MLLPVVMVAQGMLAGAQPPPSPADAPTSLRSFRHVVKEFDFDERAAGNYEETPMYWTKLAGAGLPFFNTGGFDGRVGHAAVPSFRLSIQTGNIVYEYKHLDLTIAPHSDYAIVGWVRGQNLEHSRAFLAAYFVDRFGERIAGSQHISQLVGDTHGQWQRVSIDMPGNYPSADALHIQVWILHTYAWRVPPPGAIDPIIWRDTDGKAWFDDIVVYRIPRTRLRFSDPSGLVQPGAHEALLMEVSNASDQQLDGQLRIVDEAGRPHYQRRIVVAGTPRHNAVDAAGQNGADATPPLVVHMQRRGAMSEVRVPLPPLPVGWYEASLLFFDGDRSLLERRVRFAVLPELPVAATTAPDIGVDLGAWKAASVEGARRAIASLGVGATRIGIPMIGVVDTPEKMRYYTGLGELIRRIAADGIESAGVVLTPSAANDPHAGRATVEQIEKPRAWAALAAPILAQYGGLLTRWQLGDEWLELRAGPAWTPSRVGIVREQLRRFITFPRIIVPTRLSDPSAEPPTPGAISSIAIDERVPTPDLPRMLDFLLSPAAQPRWLRLDWPVDAGLPAADRVADRARRLVLAKAMGADRVYVPMPLLIANEGGQIAWEPTQDYIWLRTLAHYLAGKQLAAAIRLPGGVQAVVFSGRGRSCLILWSWSKRPGQTVDLYVGERPVALALDGSRRKVEVVDGRAHLPVTSVPLIVDSLEAPLVGIQFSYRVEPRFLQINDPNPKPVLRFRNPYNETLTGEVTLELPPDWQVQPQHWNFSLEPGQLLRQPLTFTLPPRQLATDYPLGVSLHLVTPEDSTLGFNETMTLGLREIELSARTSWIGDDLVVDQMLTNNSTQTVSFDAFCEPPGRGRYENAFLLVAPGETATIEYGFPDARDLAGAVIHHGIAEIRGERRLDKVVEVPN